MSFAEDYDDLGTETEDLAALELERRRQQRTEAPAPAPTAEPWQPPNDVTAAIWSALPADGRGVEYWRLVRRIADGRWPPMLVQVALAGLVLLGRAYVCPAGADVSVAGRGTDPRVPFPYRTGSVVL